MEPELIDVVVPAHNEEASIGSTLHEFYRVVHNEQHFEIRFVVCEDGSVDNTRRVVEALECELPILLVSSPERKGYSRAVVDGLRAADAPLVCFIDSDGQCDPADFGRLFQALDGNDMVVGYRVARADPSYRKLMSMAFKTVYRLLFPVRLIDPSCPYIIVRRSALQPILAGNPGILQQGFWWEFNARAAAAGRSVIEAPVHHRIRQAGNTQVYRVRKIPSIAVRHLAGLITLRRELRGQHQARPVRPAI